MTQSQTKELGYVKGKSGMLIRVNGMAGTIVKCSNISYVVVSLSAMAQTQFRDAAVTALVSLRQPGGVS